MSVESWKKEFYPIPAYDYRYGRHPRLQVLDASLLKWKGLTKANLKKHRVTMVNGGIGSKDDPYFERFYFDGDSCSLCAKYYGRTADYSCDACPIWKLTGKTCLSAYSKLPDPEPMIQLLTKVRKLILKDNAKRRGE